MAYEILYSPDAEEHLGEFSKRDQKIILDAVDEQLEHQPTVKTRNRKPMRPNPLATWELRIDSFRVYYDVEEDPDPIVHIRAIGKKVRNKVNIQGEEVDL